MKENKSKIEQIRRKINEFKFNYEVAKQTRIELIKTMEDLDARLAELEEELNSAKLIYKDNHIDRISKKAKLKKSILGTILSFLCASSLFSIGNLVFEKTFLGPIESYITIFITNTILYMSPYVKEKINNNRDKRKTRSVETIEKEYQETLEKRLTEGQKYRKVREEEVLSEKIYKGTAEILTAQIAELEQNDKGSDTTIDIDTRDIYSSIVVSPQYLQEPIETKIKILDEELRKYLSKKVAQSYYNAVEPENLESFTAEQLFKMLAKQLPENERNEKLSHIIHAVINFVSNLQGYGIVWFEEDDESLISSPKIVFDEQDRWTELKTNKNTNYEMLFDIVYDTFLNQIIKKNKTKKREN